VQPLELMSLRHTQQSEGLTITGLVQNPRGSAPGTPWLGPAPCAPTDGVTSKAVNASTPVKPHMGRRDQARR